MSFPEVSVGLVSFVFHLNGVFSKWSGTFIEFSEFREFRESEESLKHELCSV